MSKPEITKQTPLQGIKPELTSFEMKCLKFVELYMMSFNASQAARQMGYEGATASAQGWEFLHSPFTQEELKKRYEQHASDNKTIRQEIIMMLHREANYFGQGASASARVKAQIQLSKIFGMEQLNVKAEIEHSGGVMLVPMVSNVKDWAEVASSYQEQLTRDSINI